MTEHILQEVDFAQLEPEPKQYGMWFWLWLASIIAGFFIVPIAFGPLGAWFGWEHNRKEKDDGPLMIVFPVAFAALNFAVVVLYRKAITM